MENLTVYTKLFEVRKAIGKINKDTKGYNYTYAFFAQVEYELNIF